jgi:hypothetical protein
VRYVITLDADTQLPRGAARKLVATIAHIIFAFMCWTPGGARRRNGERYLDLYRDLSCGSRSG